MKRRTVLTTLALGGAGAALWQARDWIPTRGVLNSCHALPLPARLAEHPVVAETLQGLDSTKLWDNHVHLLGTGDEAGADVWVNPVMDELWYPMQAIQKRLYMNASCVSEEAGGDAAYIQRLLAVSEPLPGARLMLLAFDYSYDEQGRRRPDLSTFHVSNAYAQAVAARNERFEWICSVHPYRDDALEALRWSAARGARAVKWLPPAMGMDPSSPRCDAFYEAMKALDLALLSHGGEELAVQGGGHQDLGNPLLLRRALEHGVRVIVAHCASEGVGRDFRQGKKTQREVPNFSLFMEMMREKAHDGLLFGEISATTQINRAPVAIRALLEANEIHHRLLNGSDYPLPGILPLFSLRQLVGLGVLDEDAAPAIFELQSYSPLLFDLALKRNLQWRGWRFPPPVFESGRFFAGQDLE